MAVPRDDPTADGGPRPRGLRRPQLHHHRARGQGPGLLPRQASASFTAHLLRTYVLTGLIHCARSGLLTIGPRFGGAIDGAAVMFSDALDKGLSPQEGLAASAATMKE